MSRNAVVYARISQTSEESVSVERQTEAARSYAAARGWEVVGEFVDDGVSATRSRPEDRAGWRALLDSPADYQHVIFWKIDRLARSTLDFLNAHETLVKRGAALVAVEDPIDMSTAQGELFATILAAFARAEARSISARVTAARAHLLRNGRAVGGTIPYGYRNIDNPDGPGKVRAQDPATIDYLRLIVDRTVAGETLYSTQLHLDEIGAPTPTGKGKWNYNTIDRMVRNPILAGMTPANPGNDSKARGGEVLRDEVGLPVVDESLAIMSVDEWRAMVAALDTRASHQSRPWAMKGRTDPLLSGMVWCGEHDEPKRMYRGTTQGRESYSCSTTGTDPGCGQTFSGLTDLVVEEFLDRLGDAWRWSVVEEVREGGATRIPEIDRRLSELSAELASTEDDARADEIPGEIASLRALRRDLRQQNPTVTYRAVETDSTFGDAYEAAVHSGTVEARRAVLADALASVTVRRGAPGRRTRAQALARLSFEWKAEPTGGPLTPDEIAEIAEENETQRQ
ncbi:recombinase family protein [Pimelobacter simplex]|uniref:recombinase family protein n=1 Tax=Nocardioides simplex TaxID=2045 RepID=UPI003813AD75